jgi:hypothetical protein
MPIPWSHTRTFGKGVHEPREFEQQGEYRARDVDDSADPQRAGEQHRDHDEAARVLIGPVMLLAVVPALQLMFLREEKDDDIPAPDASRAGPAPASEGG